MTQRELRYKLKKANKSNERIRQMAVMLKWVLTHYSTTNDGIWLGWADSMGREATCADIAQEYFKGEI
jgi:hypothetical protein